MFLGAIAYGPYTRAVSLILGTLVRALAVTLLLSSVLLPVADHHALARLVGVAEGDAHWAQAHHHRPSVLRSSTIERMAEAARIGRAIPLVRLPGPPLVGAVQTPSAWAVSAQETDPGGLLDNGHRASPVLVAAGAPVDGLAFATLAVDAAIVAFAISMLVARLALVLDSRPSAPWRRVPVPPPRAALLVTA